MSTRIAPTEIPYIHVVRVLACVMVVCLHSLPAPELYVSEGMDASFMHLVRVLTKPCVPLFFMITGVLIFPYKNGADFISFYKKRIPRVLYPLLFWGVVYAILPFFLDMCDFPFMLRELVMSPVKCPSQIGGILWYLFILIGIYLIIPFINQAIYTDKKMMKIYLLIWIISSAVVMVKPTFPDLLGQNVWVQNFDMTIYFSGYLGYLLAGYYLNNVKWGYLSLIFFISLMYFIGRTGMTFLSSGSVIISLSIFVILRGIVYPTEGMMYKFIKKISSKSFGIYLSQMVVYRVLTINIYACIGTRWYVQIFVMFITFIGAYILTCMLSKFSFKKYIVG